MITFNESINNRTLDTEWNIFIYCRVVFIICAVIDVVGFCANFFSILVFVSQRKLRKKHNTFVINLAVADCLAGFWGFLWNAFFGYPRILNKGKLGFTGIVVLSMFDYVIMASILSIFAVSLERFSAVVTPLKHAHYTRQRTLMYYIICIWCISITNVFDYHSGPRFCYMERSLILILVALVCFMYIPIFFIARNTTIKRQNTITAIHKDKIQTAMHVLKIFGPIVAVLWLNMFLQIGNVVSCGHRNVSNDFLSYYLYTFWASYSINTAVNPFIYWGRQTQFRIGSKNMLKTCKLTIANLFVNDTQNSVNTISGN
ncbi:substance-P receptor-like [Anneissia japonica]|uniref:substance-P receptor-like n=1 Tax=Anneissia japonica TaxID=1529436 RepID=UPI00142572D9|nr:substance-P receptor-like [Anneissia japonica]